MEASTLSTILDSATAGALATGLVSFVLLRGQSKHDASERRADRSSAEKIANANRSYENLMKVCLSMMTHIGMRIAFVRASASTAQGKPELLGAPKSLWTLEETNLAFLLAGDTVVQAIADFDAAWAALLEECTERTSSQDRTDSDGWRERAQAQADTVTSSGICAINLLREQLDMQPLISASNALKILIPELVKSEPAE